MRITPEAYSTVRRAVALSETPNPTGLEWKGAEGLVSVALVHSWR